MVPLGGGSFPLKGSGGRCSPRQRPPALPARDEPTNDCSPELNANILPVGSALRIGRGQMP
jgi:hypothetical protein